MRIFRRAVTVGIVVAVVLPVIPILMWAFGSNWFFPGLVPDEFSMRGWEYVANPRARVLQAIFTSLLIAAAVTVISAILGLPVGRLLGMPRKAGSRPSANGRGESKPFLELLVLGPLIVPGLAVLMGVQVSFIRLGLSDTILGVIIAHLLPALPYMILVLSGVYANFDPDYESQARSLGASPLRTFFRVTLPSLMPGLVTGGLFVFLISWTQYILTLLVGGGRVLTIPILLFSFASSGDRTLTAVLSIIFLIPPVVILVFTGKYLTGRSRALTGLGNI